MEKYSCTDMLSNVMSLHPKQSKIHSFCLQFWLIHDPRKQDHQIVRLVVRSGVFCQVSASSNNRMDMSSPHAGKDRKSSLEGPTDQWTYDNASDEGLSNFAFAHPTIC